MNKAGSILSVKPANAVPGGEIAVECTGFSPDRSDLKLCTINGESSRVVAASSSRVLAIVPDDVAGGDAELVLHGEVGATKPVGISVGQRLIDDMHIVANPAVDPRDDSVIFTRSGSRGQVIENTLYRLEADGYVDELTASVMNPTGVAFDRDGRLFVTNRSDGWVVQIENGEAVTFAAGLGIATGIAFDEAGELYVGDRGGKIYRVPEPGYVERFATLEPSVAAYHMAFGPDGRLYVTAPALSSFDAVYALDEAGSVEKYFRGLGRPQGLAFDTEGNLYVAAAFEGRGGIVRIAPGGESAELVVAGRNVVGLCFNRAGDMIVATDTSAYSFPLSIYGILLQ